MALPRTPKAVVFDMDGLLVDTEAVVFRAMQFAAGGAGREMPLGVFQQMVGLQNAASEPIVRAHFGEDFDIETWTAAISVHFREELAAGIALKAGAVDILDRLDDLGLPRAIATSSTLQSVHMSLGPHSRWTASTPSSPGTCRPAASPTRSPS